MFKILSDFSYCAWALWSQVFKPWDIHHLAYEWVMEATWINPHDLNKSLLLLHLLLHYTRDPNSLCFLTLCCVQEENSVRGSFWRRYVSGFLVITSISPSIRVSLVNFSIFSKNTVWQKLKRWKLELWEDLVLRFFIKRLVFSPLVNNFWTNVRKPFHFFLLIPKLGI